MMRVSISQMHMRPRPCAQSAAGGRLQHCPADGGTVEAGSRSWACRSPHFYTIRAFASTGCAAVRRRVLPVAGLTGSANDQNRRRILKGINGPDRGQEYSRGCPALWHVSFSRRAIARCELPAQLARRHAATNNEQQGSRVRAAPQAIVSQRSHIYGPTGSCAVTAQKHPSR
jgi:hypothetical protein